MFFLKQPQSGPTIEVDRNTQELKLPASFGAVVRDPNSSATSSSDCLTVTFPPSWRLFYQNEFSAEVFSPGKPERLIYAHPRGGTPSWRTEKLPYSETKPESTGFFAKLKNFLGF